MCFFCGLLRRQTKLTNILKDSLGGNCKTVMIACIWASGTLYGAAHVAAYVLNRKPVAPSKWLAAYAFYK